MGRANDLAIALELADIADAISMPRFRAPDLSWERKANGGVVSEVDLAIETAIRSHLAEVRPHDAVTGEEFGTTGTGSRHWLIDPIDGSGAFAEGGDGWSTLIGLVDGDGPVAGVVTRPVVPTRAWAGIGQGAFIDGRPIRVSDTAALSDATICEDFRVSIGRGLDWNPLPALARHCAAVHPFDDVFGLLRVADGTVDVNLGWWSGSGPDLAPFVCILLEAGGRFTDLNGRCDFYQNVWLATNGTLHDQALALVREIIETNGMDPAVDPPEDLEAILRARLQQPGPGPAGS